MRFRSIFHSQSTLRERQRVSPLPYRFFHCFPRILFIPLFRLMPKQFCQTTRRFYHYFLRFTLVFNQYTYILFLLFYYCSDSIMGMYGNFYGLTFRRDNSKNCMIKNGTKEYKSFRGPVSCIIFIF